MKRVSGLPAATLAAALVAALAAGLVTACSAPDRDGQSQGSPSPAGPAATAGPATPPATAAPGATASPPLSSVPLPTLGQPTAAPSGPTDNNPANTVAGRVVKGGSGPCYTLENDDGRLFALYNRSGIRLQEGTYVTAKVGPLQEKISCGEGIPMEMLSAQKQ